MPVIQSESARRYDLEERTERFARQVMDFVRCLKPGLVNQEVARQLVRSAGSVGANYIEANSSLGKKDFLMRARICRKEAKESAYWLRLVLLCHVLAL
jgi:four helix bundle protein